jgi:DNA-binding CsgD family transcriptional regulator
MDIELLRIVGLIYDAVIGRSGWDVALNAIRVRHGWYNASMSVLALPTKRAVLSVAINIPESLHDIPNITDDIAQMWGGLPHLYQLPLEEPIFQSHQTDPAGWHDLGLAQWSIPQGITDQVGIFLARDRTALANVAFAQHESMTEVPAGVIEELRLLAPHLRRAATIGEILERSEVRAATFEAALDAASTGAVLVRGDMEIVHANAAADDMLSSGDPIRSSRGRLELSAEVVAGHLETAVQAAAEGAGAIGRRGIGIPARRRDGSPLVTHVLPLASRLGTRPAADAVVFLADNGGAETQFTESLELLFALTPAEARVFELVAEGRSSREISMAMGIAASTMRTHLLRVFDKTGKHRRSELVALARELSPVG